MCLSVMWPREHIPKGDVFRRDWTMCSKHVNHLSSIVSIIWETYMTIPWAWLKLFTLIISTISIWAPKTIRKWFWPWFGLANQIVLIACFMSCEKWASGKKNYHFKAHYLTLGTSQILEDSIKMTYKLSITMPTPMWDVATIFAIALVKVATFQVWCLSSNTW